MYENAMELTKTTTAAIHAYCRVLELQQKAVEQGSSPDLGGPVGAAVNQAAMGLKREVDFLRFIREEKFATTQRGCPGD